MPQQAIIDPLFSKKLEESNVVSGSEQDLIAKIQILYASLENNSPVYYQGSGMGSALDAFAASEDFLHLTAQLDICFEQLRFFCDAQGIFISNVASPIAASTLLQVFLEKLKTDFFSDRRALLYGPGKKYLEIMSVFINEPSIDLNFRTLQIINLLSDEGLAQSCAEGCFTRLQYAADNLKNYGNFELPALYKNYLQILADEIIYQPILINGEESITRKIARWMRYDPIAFEIHVRNFMTKRFKEKFNLKNLETVLDDYVNTIENFFKRNRQKSKLLDSNFEQLLKSFNEKATATNFVKYLSSVIYKAFSTQGDYMERVKFLEEKALPSFGQDAEFSLAEVLSDETGLLKDEECLDITITERLLNKGWFDLDWSKRYRKNPFFKQRNPQWLNINPPFPPFTDNYKLFYGNLPLSWIKADTVRQKIVTVLQQEQGLTTIQSIYSDQVALLNTLIQTPEDLTIFLNQLAPSQYELALAWINSVPKFVRNVLSYYSNDASKGDVLEPLLSFLSQLKAQNIKKIFAKQLNLKGLLQLRIEKLSTYVDSMEGNYNKLIKKTCSLRVIDFSYFIFYRNLNFYKDSYLTEIDFSHMNIDLSTFYEDIYSCSFIYSKMTNTLFYSQIFATDFAFSRLEGIQFYAKVEQSLFSNAELSTVSFKEMVRNDFLSSKLSQIEFTRHVMQCDLTNTQIIDTLFLKPVVGTNFHRANIESTIFRDKIRSCRFSLVNFYDIEFYSLIHDTSFTPSHLFRVKFFCPLVDNKFNFATLDDVIFLKKVYRSIFTNSNLKEILFEKEIVNSIFDYMTGSELSFKRRVTSVNFMNLNLINSQFDGKIEDCDFSSSQLNKVYFFGGIDAVKFNTAHLNDISFIGNIKDCDFIGSNLYFASFNNLELNDINFIKTDLLEVTFLEANLINNYFLNALLVRVKFENTILEQVSFNKADLSGTLFKQTQFKIQVDFIESDLKNAEFNECDLSLVNFHDSINLQYLKIKESVITPRQLFDNFYSAGLRDFSEILLSETDISKKDFLKIYKEKPLQEAILSESAFKGLAKLGYRNFARTDLSKLQLTEFIHLYHNIEYNFIDAKLPQVFLPQEINPRAEQRPLSLKDCLPKDLRNKRIIKQCSINWNDIDLFNINSEDNRNFEEIIIDADAFINTLFFTRDKKKQGKLVELIDTVDITGTDSTALMELRNTQKLQQLYYRLGNLFDALSQGLFYENIVMDFVHEDYSGVAVNVGLLIGSGLMENFAEQILVISKKFGISGKVFFSRLLEFSAPFLRRGLSLGYVIYDLVKQVKALTKGDSDALINILQDVCIVSFDVIEAEIEVLELAEISREIAELIKVTGKIINGVILTGSQVYHAARKVAEIRALVPLTPQQEFLEGLNAFLLFNPSEDFHALLEYDQAYAIYSRNIKAFLKKHPAIKYYAVPLLDLVGEYSHRRRVCALIAGIAVTCNPKVTTHIELILDSVIYLKKEVESGLLFNELNPLKNHFKPVEIFCNPYRIKFDHETLTCDSTLVFINPWSDEMQNQTLIALEEGYDVAYAFSDTPNTFMVNDGYKIYVGGIYTDRFVVKASMVRGRLDASLGSDLLDLRLYSSEDNNALLIDLPNGILKLQQAYDPLTIRNFERILGRSQQKDSLFATHRTEFIDLQGGSELAFDEITIAPNIRNARLELVVRDQTIINNLATNGHFIYLVPIIEKSSSKNVQRKKNSSLYFTNRASTANHTFLFEYDLEDLSSVIINQEMNEYNLYFDFLFASNSTFSNLMIKLKNFPTRYAHYFFKDHTQLKIGEKTNLYAFQSSVLRVSNLIEHYAPLARRLGITLFIHQSQNNEVVVIGHANHQVLKNDLFATKTHLVGNGGGNSYVMIPDKHNPIPSIPDVVIYQLTTDETQHVLELRELNAEFKGGLLGNPLIEVNVLTIAQDLQLALLHKSLQDPEDVFKITPIANILLKKGTQWYQKLTILFNRVPFKLHEVESNLWQLHPRPLNFDACHKNIILTKDDIEKDNQIFLHRPMEQQHWLRNGSDLWLTTLFTSTSDLNKNYTLLFKDFYPNTKKMQSLQLIFRDTALLLSECAEEIANAENLQEKLTLLELSAWGKVSKQRTAPKKQQNPPPLQAKVLNHRLSHTLFFSTHLVSSAASLHQGWLSVLKENIQKTLGQLQTTGQAIVNFSWRNIFSSKLEQTLVANEDAIATDINTSTLNATRVNPSTLPPSENIKLLGQQSNNAFQSNVVAPYGNLNTGVIQLMDLAIRKYYSKQDMSTTYVKNCSPKQEKYNSTLFLQKNCDMAQERLQQAIARYGIYRE